MAIAAHQARDATDAATVRELVIDIGDATSIVGAEAFPALESLTIHGRKTLSLRGLAPLTSLRSLVVGAYALADLDALAPLRLRKLELLVQRLPTLTGLASDTLLDLRVWNTGLKTLEGLALPRLRRLDVSMNKIADLAPLATLPALRSLNLQDNPAANIDVLAGLPEMRSLSLTGMGKVKSLEPLRGLTQLSSLVLTRVGARTREAVAHVPPGAILDAFAPKPAVPPEPLPTLPWHEAAVRAGLASEDEVAEIVEWEPSAVNAATWTGAAELRGLIALRTSAGEFTPLASLPHLTHLLVRGNMVQQADGSWAPDPIDLSGLTRAPQLSRLTIQHRLASLASLPTLPSLRHLEVSSGTGAAISIEGIERFTSLCTLTVTGPLADDAPLARAPHVTLKTR